MSVQPVRLSQTAWKGATYKKAWALLTSDGVTPRNLSGYTAQFTVINPHTGATLLDISTTSGEVTLSNGMVNVVLSGPTTTGFTWTGGFYKLFLTDPQGSTDLVLCGPFKIRKL
ncbi:MAG: hypothetical protein JWR61_5877 [Ferruginibacter sp.]|uniref:hypothetical protein n=1 Tax=Ferruginibacter sp. TaxID=1940288 RepID=UPI00265A96C6|nr:hypothetical protein [Ferruginibacter sp.]MDB5280922.1 hypothetical protein [Ferruginibacter sp.]